MSGGPADDPALTVPLSPWPPVVPAGSVAFVAHQDDLRRAVEALRWSASDHDGWAKDYAEADRAAADRIEAILPEADR